MVRIVLDKKDVVSWTAPASKKPKKGKAEGEGKQEGGNKAKEEDKNSTPGKCQPRNLRGTGNADRSKTSFTSKPRKEAPIINISIDGGPVLNFV